MKEIVEIYKKFADARGGLLNSSEQSDYWADFGYRIYQKYVLPTIEKEQEQREKELQKKITNLNRKDTK